MVDAHAVDLEAARRGRPAPAARSSTDDRAAASWRAGSAAPSPAGPAPRTATSNGRLHAPSRRRSWRGTRSRRRSPRPTTRSPGSNARTGPMRDRTRVPSASTHLDQLVVAEVGRSSRTTPSPPPSRRSRTRSGRSTTSTRPRGAPAHDRAQRPDRRRAPRAPSACPGTHVGVADEGGDEAVVGSRVERRRARRPGGAGPSRMTATRSARLSASSWSWVTNTAVALGVARGSLAPRRAPAARSAASRLENGSSSSTSAGSGRQRPRQRDPLLLAARQLVRAAGRRRRPGRRGRASRRPGRGAAGAVAHAVADVVAPR